MTRSIFGWSYPPGCSGPPDEPPESELAIEVWGLLEDAGVDQATLERIDSAIYELEAKADAHCPECERRAIEAEIKMDEDLRRHFYEEQEAILQEEQSNESSDQTS